MRYLLSLSLFVLGIPLLSSQNLYSFESSRQFADYLFSKGDYEFASEEYARLLFMQPANDSILVKLSQSYRKQDQFALATSIFDHQRRPDFSHDWVENEYLATLLFQKDSNKFYSGLSRMRYLEAKEIERKQIEFSLLARDWKKASQLLEDIEPDAIWTTQYRETLESAQAFRPKKPWLAATFSAFIPGTGKMYAKNVKEGVTSLFFVSALGYQSYRAFKKRGSKAVSGWIYGGLSLGFYLGNIYGSHQSAKNYNNRTLNAIYHEVDQSIMDRY